ncbi:MAG: M20/M25/M40 family metallo-hydrolase [Deltaproteobacteria bacterium]|nr:M20/M25/M40 family metallo-hydrolase [Deltaproteobacteria bacterium]
MLQQYVKDLVALPGISSYEKPVADYIINHLKQTQAAVDVNHLGCVTAVFEGKKNQIGKVLIDAHMDEVGFIVQHIEAGGFLKIVNYGSVDARVIPAQRMEVHAAKGKRFAGVVGLLPPHVTAGKDVSVIPLDQLVLDCGFKSAQEVEAKGIRVGSAITFLHQFTEVANNRFASKALDDRVGCALLLSTADWLTKNTPKRTVVLSFSVQEEIGAKGVFSVLQKVKPEYALAVECTTACDTYGVPANKTVSKLGSGPALTVADNCTVISPDIVDFLIKTAKKGKIKHQLKTPRFGATNAGEFHMVKDGVKFAVMAVPSRYIHSSVSMCDWSDIKAAEALIKKYISDI